MCVFVIFYQVKMQMVDRKVLLFVYLILFLCEFVMQK